MTQIKASPQQGTDHLMIQSPVADYRWPWAEPLIKRQCNNRGEKVTCGGRKGPENGKGSAMALYAGLDGEETLGVQTLVSALADPDVHHALAERAPPRA